MASTGRSDVDGSDRGGSSISVAPLAASANNQSVKLWSKKDEGSAEVQEDKGSLNIIPCTSGPITIRNEG
jgi:hypothetical protein